MPEPQPYRWGGIVLGAIAVGALAFALRVALFRVYGEPVDLTEALLVTGAVVATVVVLSLRRKDAAGPPGR